MTTSSQGDLFFTDDMRFSLGTTPITTSFQNNTSQWLASGEGIVILKQSNGTIATVTNGSLGWIGNDGNPQGIPAHAGAGTDYGEYILINNNDFLYGVESLLNGKLEAGVQEFSSVLRASEILFSSDLNGDGFVGGSIINPQPIPFLLEGQGVTFNIDTPYINSVIYWSTYNPLDPSQIPGGTLGAGITQSDFSSGAIRGSALTDDYGKTSISIEAAYDNKTEGPEYFSFYLFEDETWNKLIGTGSNAIEIKDTSFIPDAEIIFQGTWARAQNLLSVGTIKGTSIEVRPDIVELVSSGEKYFSVIFDDNQVAYDYVDGQLVDDWGFPISYESALKIADIDGKHFEYLSHYYQLYKDSDSNNILDVNDQFIGRYLTGFDNGISESGEFYIDRNFNFSSFDYRFPFASNKFSIPFGLEEEKSLAILPNIFIRDNSIYTIVDGPTWADAEENANRLGGHLVSINSSEENSFISQNFSSHPDLVKDSPVGDYHYTHIGLYDDSHGNLYWSDSSPVNYINWAPTNPYNNGTNLGDWNLNDFGIQWGHWAPEYSDKWVNGTPGPSSGIAEIPFKTRGDSAYVIVEGPTWEEAEANAQILGGHLVTINDQAENDWIFETLLKNKIDDWGAWIGATDKISEGVWKDHSGINLSYTNFFSPEPNNLAWYDSEGEDYAAMLTEATVNGGKWADIANSPPNNNIIKGIAEIKLPPSYFSPLSLSYALKAESDSNLTQLAVLGDSVDHSSRFTLELSAASLRHDYLLESADITLSFDPLIFGDIQASDIRIGSALPIANAVEIDNQNGTIRIAAASLSDLNPLTTGTGIASETVFASISLDFDETYLQTVAQNQDGSLLSNPLSFELYANANDTVFSRSFTDSSGKLNRDIQTLGQLGGSIAVSGQDVTLYEAKINLEQLGDGLVLGTQRVIGSDAAFTNLLRSGDTITSSAQWLNVGNIAASNITVSGLANANAQLLHSSLTAATINSGSFVDGLFRTDGRESTTLTADIKITGAAGSIVNLADGILSIQADGSTLFSNLGKGSKNLITFQGDLNYDGRVSMKDLAYLNAGAARQQLITSPNGPATTVAAGSLARDVDANFDGRIDLADLAVLDADWGKTLHTGIEGSFLGSGSQTSHITWEQLDSQGTTTWNNTVFKDQNALEASASFIGSLESPLSTGVIGADGDLDPNNPDITGTFFQDQGLG